MSYQTVYLGKSRELGLKKMFCQSNAAGHLEGEIVVEQP